MRQAERLAILGGPCAVFAPAEASPGLSPMAEQAAMEYLGRVRHDLGLLSDLEARGAVGEFEEEMARVACAEFAVAMSSGTAGLIAALLAVGVGTGDEVIVSDYGWGGTVGAVLTVGAEPVFADIEPGSPNVDVEAVRRAVSRRTRAILATHLFGQPAEAAALEELANSLGLRLVFDGAQALGARVDGRGIGAFGDATVFSFGRGKLLTTGEGGMVATNDADVYERLLLVAQHPVRALAEIDTPALRELVDESALSVRMAPLAAVIGKAEIDAAHSRLVRRREAGRKLHRLLDGCPGWRLPTEPEGIEFAFHTFALEYDPRHWRGLSRDSVLAALQAEGVPAVLGPVRVPLHLRPRYRGLNAWSRDGAGGCPVAEHRCAAMEVVLDAPIGGGAAVGEWVRDVAAALVKVFRGQSQMLSAPWENSRSSGAATWTL
jgi:perosamine synthetase